MPPYVDVDALYSSFVACVNVVFAHAAVLDRRYGVEQRALLASLLGKHLGVPLPIGAQLSGD